MAFQESDKPSTGMNAESGHLGPIAIDKRRHIVRFPGI
jgi:hypothetical protein